MEEEKHIGLHIVDYLLNGNNKEIDDSTLKTWLAESESNRKVFAQYKKIWEESHHYMETETFDIHQAWKKVDEINQKRGKRQRGITHFYYGISGVAASVLLFFLLSFMGLFVKNSTTHLSINADYGNRSEITLPDGSIVKLNSGTTIHYAYNTKKKIREVEFTGEGFFDVSKSKDPFVIKTANDVEIKVLGTSFNLRAYPDDSEIQASLIEGSIEMKHEINTLLLKAGEMAVYNKENEQLKTTEGLLSHTYGWLDNKLYMDNMSLSDVCKQLERWYDVNITLEQELGTGIHYNGVLQEESIIDVLEALSKLSEIQYRMKGRSIYITSK